MSNNFEQQQHQQQQQTVFETGTAAAVLVWYCTTASSIDTTSVDYTTEYRNAFYTRYYIRLLLLGQII